VSPETVQEVLKSDQLYVEELDLFTAVVEWGKAQVLKANPDSEPDPSKIRKTISPILKCVRFSLFDVQEFAKLCNTDKILSYKEKMQIFMCLTLNSLEFMPIEFSGASQEPRLKLVDVISLPYVNHGSSDPSYTIDTRSLCFVVDKRARLVGLNINASDSKFESELKNSALLLCDANGTKLCSICKKDMMGVFQGKKYIQVKMCEDFVLEQNVAYKLKWQCSGNQPIMLYQLFTSTRKGEFLSVTFKTTYTYLPLTELVFKLV